MSIYVILLMVIKKILFILIILVFIFPVKIFAVLGDPGTGLGDEGSGGGGHPAPTGAPIPMITIAPEPSPTGAQPGYKYMWKCKSGNECDGLPNHICPPMGSNYYDVGVDQCWHQDVREETDIRQACFYPPDLNYDVYNCFEDEFLCKNACDPYPTGPYPTEPDGGFTYYSCKPGCRTCEGLKFTDISACQGFFKNLLDCGAGNAYCQRNWCETSYCRYALRRPNDQACVDQCMNDYGCTTAGCWAWYQGAYRNKVCFLKEKDQTCQYYCDPLKQGVPPGCGENQPQPFPTEVPDYWFCNGNECQAKNNNLPNPCQMLPPEQIAQCLNTKIFPNEGMCTAGCHCANSCNCSANTCSGEVCVDTCGNVCNGAKSCDVTIKEPPGLIIENPLDGSKIGATDTDGRIHICDDKFWLIGSTTPPTRAKFVVTLSSARGADKITGVSIGFTHNGIDDLIYNIFNLQLAPINWEIAKLGAGKDSVIVTPYASPLLPGDTEREITLDITYVKDGGGNNFPINLNNIFVSAVDDEMRFLPWTSTDKAFKFWDCKVTYDGTLFDDSGDPDRGVCETHGYHTPASDSIKFQSLTFTNTKVGGDSVVASVVNNTFTCPFGNELIWGKTYNSVFNPDINCDTAGLLARTIDLTGSVGTTSCMGNSQINTERYNLIDIPKYTIDPYVDSPRIKLDFSLEQFSDQWYQVAGGGVKALGGISNKLNGSAYMVKNVGTSDAGWIAAGETLDMGKDTGFSESDWKVEDVNSKGGFFGTRVSYSYFLNEFKIKKGIGTTENNWDNIRNNTGVFFVSGNLDIEKDSTPLLGVTDYRIVIVSGNLKIGDSATSVQGIYLADGNITIDGESALDAQLLINGILYSQGNISITRNFKTHSENNSKPAVKVTFDPNLIFRMPNAVYNVMSNWRQGI